MTEHQPIETGSMVIEPDHSAVIVYTKDGRVMSWAEWMAEEGAGQENNGESA